MSVAGSESRLDFLEVVTEPNTPSNAFIIKVSLVRNLHEADLIPRTILLSWQTDDPEFEKLNSSVTGEIVP